MLASLDISASAQDDFPEDASDALSIAVHHANTIELKIRMNRGFQRDREV